MFQTMKQVVLSYGYEEYDGPMLESLELYKAKSGEEIVSRQLYSFTDKGGREVAIRPEMTPTLARMVAARQRELPKPIRWFSFPNLWRYEQPGKGRLREHWQLNVDVFGIDGMEAELEILQLACDILFAFGATGDMFRVRVSHRKILDGFLENTLNLSEIKAKEVSRLLDKKAKMQEEEFQMEWKKILPENPESYHKVLEFLNLNQTNIQNFPGLPQKPIQDILYLLTKINDLGLGNVIVLDPSIVRGFDYYTGVVFEIFDVSPENSRSLYGGGRYDNLTGLFTNEPLSGIGFGLGDVTLQNFLETHDLLPKIGKGKVVGIPVLSEKLVLPVFQISKQLRKNGIPCEILFQNNYKLSKQIQIAEKKGLQYLLIVGEEELEKGIYSWKDLERRTQTQLPKEDWIEIIQRILQD